MRWSRAAGRWRSPTSISISPRRSPAAPAACRTPKRSRSTPPTARRSDAIVQTSCARHGAHRRAGQRRRRHARARHPEDRLRRHDAGARGTACSHVNLQSVLHCTHAVLPAMIAARRGAHRQHRGEPRAARRPAAPRSIRPPRPPSSCSASRSRRRSARTASASTRSRPAMRRRAGRSRRSEAEPQPARARDLRRGRRQGGRVPAVRRRRPHHRQLPRRVGRHDAALAKAFSVSAGTPRCRASTCPAPCRGFSVRRPSAPRSPTPRR